MLLARRGFISIWCIDRVSRDSLLPHPLSSSFGGGSGVKTTLKRHGADHRELGHDFDIKFTSRLCTVL